MIFPTLAHHTPASPTLQFSSHESFLHAAQEQANVKPRAALWIVDEIMDIFDQMMRDGLIEEIDEMLKNAPTEMHEDLADTVCLATLPVRYKLKNWESFKDAHHVDDFPP